MPLVETNDRATESEPPRKAPGLRRVPAPAARAPRRSGAVARLLAVPLLWKLVGANALILLSAAAVVLLTRQLPVLWGALALSFVVNLVLVHVALLPLRGLEDTASRVWHGDFEARVAPSPVADRDMARIGGILNLLLDSLTGDRSRMRLLASQVISAQDAERSRVARELHDSTAQTLAAAMLQLQAAVQQNRDPEMAERLATLRQLVADALEEVRVLSHMIHPRVLDDLGLVAALEWLARQTERATSLEVLVEADVARGVEIPTSVASVLYRVAQEGLRNAVTHAKATSVTLRVEADDAQATIEIADDGCGFDVGAAEARRPGMGLFSMRERVGLVNGSVEFYSVIGRGTRISATVPL